MDYNRYISGVITEKFNAGLPVVLATIISMEGSTPRESGSRMVIVENNETFGTVGGGLMEAVTIKKSVKVLNAAKSEIIEIDMAGTDTSSPDMICGGSAVLLLDYLENSDMHREIFTRMGKLIDEGESFYYITAYKDNDGTDDINGHCLLFSDGTTFGDGILAGNVLPTIREELHNISSTTTLTVGGINFIIEPMRRVKTMYCFGAGHVAVPTVHIASMVGFRTVVIDDRDEFANKERFPDAERVEVIDDYTRALVGFDIDEDSFIVILTRGHRYDREVLEQAIQTDAGYIGMISSRKKRDAVYATLIKEGVTTAKGLERVHSPIGLPIGGETPEEIAVSIVAEMIAVRGKKE